MKIQQINGGDIVLILAIQFLCKNVPFLQNPITGRIEGN